MTQCRRATKADLYTILTWAAQEGWNPGLEDAEAFYTADPKGFFVATVDGEPVAAISVVNHNSTYAFLGLYITRPAFRGQGIGYRLWQHGVSYAGTRTIGLDGVPDQQENYARSGFKKHSETTRFVGVVSGKPDPDIRLATLQDIPNLIALEAAASGQSKPTYLQSWFTQQSSRKTIVLTSGNNIAGACTIRQCKTGTKIGPLWANTSFQSERLIRHAVSICDGETMIDVPTTATDLTNLCADLNLTPTFETARMYRGRISNSASKLFANFSVTSLELG